MTDRFKLRVWDKYLLKYWHQDHIKINLRWLIYPEDFKYGNYLPDCVVVEQCTGLTDDNGKLVYEGDLVKWGGYSVCQVIWSDDSAEFMFKNLNEDLREHVDTMLLYDWEVVGNIHENPEMLNES